jgi:hypothetical protein
MKKTNEDRMKRVSELAESHYGVGEVKFVGIKYEPFTGVFTAKLKLNSFTSLYESSETAEGAIKKVKNRIKKIIRRYNAV